MDQITVRIPEETLESLEENAEDAGVSRSEYIRDVLDSHRDMDDMQREHEQDVETLRTDLETQMADLERENDRLRNEKRALIENRQDTKELVEYVEEQRELTRYQERRQRLLDDATILRRWKWKFTGVPVEERPAERG